MENQAKNLKVGDKIFVVSGSSYHSYSPAVVSKITPSGYIDLRIGSQTEDKRFKPNGELLGGSRYFDYCIDYLPFEERVAERAKEDRLRAAAQAINAVKLSEPVRAQWGADSMARKVEELQALLNAARVAVEAVEGGAR